MNWKIAVVGGIVFYVVMFVLSFALAPLFHEGVLKELYQANEHFWRPELRGAEPDMGALMPMWIVNGIIFSVVVAGIYSIIRPALGGAGWMRGLKFGLLLSVFIYVLYLSWWGGL